MIVRILWNVAALACLPAPLRAQDQDTIRILKDGKETVVLGRVKAIDCDKVQYEIFGEDGKTKAQNVAADDVVSILFGKLNKHPEFVDAEEDMQQENWTGAIANWNKAISLSENVKPLHQLAIYNLALSYYHAGQADRAAEAIHRLQKEYPNSFYLRDSYELLYRVSREKGDWGASAAAIDAFKSAGDRLKKPLWGKRAELLRGDLLEAKGSHAEAAALYNRLTGDRDVEDEAAIGELRCLAAMQNMDTLKAKAEAIVRGGGKGSAYRRTAAFNALGLYYLDKGQTKEAMLNFLRGICEFDEEVRNSEVHEASLGWSAIAMSKYAREQKDPDAREKYSERAQALYAELRQTYPRSALIAKVEEELKAK